MTDTAMSVLNPGHDDRLVVRMVVDEQPIIRKRYRDDSGRAVHAAMSELWASPFGATRTTPGLPEPLAYDPDERTLDMAVIEGPAVGSRGDVGALPRLLDETATLLADLHGSGVVVSRRRTPDKLLRSLSRKLGTDDHMIVDRVAAHAPEAWTLCPNHGDFSPRNIMVTAGGPALIDFDRVQMASPSRDVSYLAAWCWVTSVINATATADDAWRLGDEFEDAYTTLRPDATADLRRGRTFHRAAGLVRIATEWTSMTTDPEASAMVLDEACRITSSRRRSG